MASSSPESSPSSTRHSSLDSFKCAPLQNPRTQDVFQSIVKGRKSWKTLRGGEVVWPPELEAALIEGEFNLFSAPISFHPTPPHSEFLSRKLFLTSTPLPCSRSGKLSTRRFKGDTSPRTLPYAEQVHFGLDLRENRQTTDSQTGREPSTTAQRYVWRQTT